MKEVRRALFLPRPLRPALETEARLLAAGVPCYVEPLLNVRPLQPAQGLPPPEAPGIVVVTSAAVFDFFPFEFSGRLILAAGAATAERGRDNGYDCEQAGETADALLLYILSKIDPSLPVFYAGAARPRLDLAAELRARGREARFYPLYESLPSPALSRPALFLLKSGRIGGAAMYSPAMSAAWRVACAAGGAADVCAELPHYCISPQAARPLVDFVKNSFILTAEAPARAGVERLIRQNYGT